MNCPQIAVALPMDPIQVSVSHFAAALVKKFHKLLFAQQFLANRIAEAIVHRLAVSVVAAAAIPLRHQTMSVLSAGGHHY